MALLLRAKCLVIGTFSRINDIMNVVVYTGDSCVGKSAIVQSFHSDGTHYPKNYTMVNFYYISASSFDVFYRQPGWKCASRPSV